MLLAVVQQEEGRAAHLHHVQPPPVVVSLSQEAWFVWLVWQGSAAKAVAVSVNATKDFMG